jgi:hypothetical protein
MHAKHIENTKAGKDKQNTYEIGFLKTSKNFKSLNFESAGDASNKSENE